MTNPDTPRTLTVHHLGRSQSERIVWLCEELGLDYALERHDRRTDNRLAPSEYKALHPMGTAPVITDGPVVLGESAAIVEYLLATRGNGRLAVAPGSAGFADYLYWFHFANGTLQPLVLQVWLLERCAGSDDHPVLQSARRRFDLVFSTVDRRLGETPHLAGAEFTAADVMLVFSLTTMRLFKPYDLSPPGRTSSPTCNASANGRRIGARCTRPIRTSCPCWTRRPERRIRRSRRSPAAAPHARGCAARPPCRPSPSRRRPPAAGAAWCRAGRWPRRSSR